MTSPAADQPDTAEIAGLLAWARSLTQAGPAADPAERAAYHTAKTALLARITSPHPHHPETSTKDVL